MTHAVKLDPSWPISLALHGLLLAAILSLPRPHQLRLPAEDSVPVELVAPTPDQAKLQPQAPTRTRPPSAAVAPRPEAPEAPKTPEPATQAPAPQAPATQAPETQAAEAPAVPKPTLVKAHSFYAAKVLADPRSRRARQELTTFAPDERAIQLCNIEAMEQIRRWKAEFRPDLVVPYATGNLGIDGGAIHAQGGAFRSRGLWYGVTFSCDVAEGAVTAFEFSVGAAIPEARWAEYNLVAGDPED